MEDKGSKNIVELYFRANNNKNRNAIINEDGRNYSVAELTVLACLAIVAREAEMCKLPYLPKEADYDRLIKTLIINSLDGMTDGLSKKEEYDKIIKSYKEINPDIYGATVVYKGMEDNFARYLDPCYPEEIFVFENVSLHDRIRENQLYWGAKSERLESILEHIYGCLVLAVGIESEYGYHIDYSKLYKMLLIHETDENTLSKLSGGQTLINLLNEFKSNNTLESEYANNIKLLESDMQVKIYDLDGKYDFDSLPSNDVTKSDEVKEIITNGANSVFDIYYEFDKKKFNKLPCMRRMLDETKSRTNSLTVEDEVKYDRVVVPRLRGKNSISIFY